MRTRLLSYALRGVHRALSRISSALGELAAFVQVDPFRHEADLREVARDPEPEISPEEREAQERAAILALPEDALKKLCQELLLPWSLYRGMSRGALADRLLRTRAGGDVTRRHRAYFLSQSLAQLRTFGLARLGHANYRRADLIDKLTDHLDMRFALEREADRKRMIERERDLHVMYMSSSSPRAH